MIQYFQTRPKGRQIAIVAWRGWLGAMARMPLLFLASAALFALLSLGTRMAGAALGIIPDTFLGGISSPDSWFYALKELTKLVLAIPVALATCRFVLLEEDGAGLFSRASLGFFLWSMAIGGFSLGLLFLKSFATAPSLQALVYVLWLLVLATPLFLSPVFPALAARTQAGGITDRMEASLAQWNGNFLLFLRAAFFTLGPPVLVVVLAQKIVARVGGQALLDRLHGAQAYNLTVAGLTPFLVALLAAMGAVLYSWTCRAAARPAGNLDRTGLNASA